MTHLPKTLHIEIQKDDTIDGFAAYVVSPGEDGNRVVLLNVYSTLLSSTEEDLDPREFILTNLMHEFGHAMQHYLDMEFDEDQVERIIQTYIEKYGSEEANAKI